MVELDQGGRNRVAARGLPVPPRLSAVVERVSVFQTPASRSAWRIVPDASAHLIWHRMRDGRRRSVLVGPRPRFCDIDPGGRQQSVCIRLRPGVLPLLVGESAWDWRHRTMALAEIDPGLEPALQRSESGEGAAQHLLGWIGRFVEGRTVDWRAAATVGLWGREVRLRFRDAVQRVGASERGVRDSIRDHVGLRPKEAQRILRLHRALSSALDGRDPTRAAQDAGYVDQSHYIKDCKALLGETPTRFAARGLTPGA